MAIASMAPLPESISGELVVRLTARQRELLHAAIGSFILDVRSERGPGDPWLDSSNPRPSPLRHGELTALERAIDGKAPDGRSTEAVQITVTSGASWACLHVASDDDLGPLLRELGRHAPREGEP